MAIQTKVLREEYRDLDWVVQVQYDAKVARRWESMAAFNVRAIAIKYAEDAKKTNRRLAYRVLELSKVQPTHAIIFETDPVTEAA